MVGSTVLKKVAPDGKLILYIRGRDFSNYTEPIDGVVEADDIYLQGRSIFAQLVVRFRYGREKDEVMGLKFHRDLCLASKKLIPVSQNAEIFTNVQNAIIEKLGTTSTYPLTLFFSKTSPASVSLQTNVNEDHSKACGIHYFVRVFVSKREKDSARRNSIRMNIRILNFAPLTLLRCPPPHSTVTENFMVCSGAIELEATLDKKIFQPNETIPVNINVQNHSNKAVKKLHVTLVQTVAIHMLQKGRYKRMISEYISRTGCPIRPGSTLQITVYVTPTLTGNHEKECIALDGHPKREQCKLASSTFWQDKKIKDSFGIVVSYAVQIRAHVGGSIGSDLFVNLPFFLGYAKGSGEEMDISV